MNFSSQKLLDGGENGWKRLVYLLLDARLPVDEPQVPVGEGADQVDLGEDGQVRDVCRGGAARQGPVCKIWADLLFIYLFILAKA